MYDVLANICIKPVHFWFLGMAELPTVKLLKLQEQLQRTLQFALTTWVNSSLYNKQDTYLFNRKVSCNPSTTM
jgi:hypothetical protein